MVSSYFPKDEYERRWQRLDDEMRAKGYEYALVIGKGAGSYERSMDVLYLSNFYSTTSGHEPDSPLWNARSYCALLCQRGRSPVLFADDVNWQRDVVMVEEVTAHFDVIQAIAGGVRERCGNGEVVIVGSDFFPVKYMRQLETLTPDIRYQVDDDLVRELRRVKSPRELDCYREAGEVTGRALNQLMESLIAGSTQVEAASKAGATLIRAGATWRRMILNHGETLDYLERDSIRGYSSDAPTDGQMVRAWIDSVFEGYWLDPGRSAICGGSPTPTQKAVLEKAVDICERLRGEIQPGVRVLDIALLGEQLVGESGYADSAQEAWPYFGHGVGCMWEAPIFDKNCCRDDEVFESGMVLGVECFLRCPETGVAGYEDNFIVTDDGTEVITPADSYWW